MRWPWGRTERRESSYTDLLVDLALQRASGTKTASVTATGVLQAASGMVSRAFAAATVEGPAHLVAAVTPECLSMTGRALMRTGEIVHVIEVDPDGAVALRPVSHFDVQGDVDPETWIYRCNLPAPSTTVTRQVPADGLIHCRFEVDPERPWKGIGPLQSASLAGRLSAETAAALADGESGPRGSLLPLPVDGADSSVAALKTDLRGLSGQLAFVESTKVMHPGAAGNAPSGDWDTKRIGADPPDSEVTLLTAAGMETAAALGCAGLFDARTNATAAREVYRRWLHGTVAPLGRLVSAELSAKLDADVTLDFSAAMAADVQGRARAWRALAGRDAVMDPMMAARIVGFEGGDE